MLKKNHYKNIIETNNIAYWEITSGINSHYWSPRFIQSLGYSSDKLIFNFDFFVNKLLHKNHIQSFKNNYFSFLEKNIPFRQLIRVITVEGKHKEFICKTKSDTALKTHPKSKIIHFIERNLKTANEFVEDDYFYYQESAQLNKTGSWYFDFVNKKTYWDLEARRILEYPEDYIPSLKHYKSYYDEESYEKVGFLYNNCVLAGEPFEAELKMRTKNGNSFWVHVVARPVYSEDGKVIGMRGIFQDIDESKKKELKLRENNDIITSQNTRLVNFAGIVSHNLKSHAGNLSLLVEMIEQSSCDEEKLELFSNIKSVSKSLNLTVEHLKEVATIQTNKRLTRSNVSFNETLESVKQSIGNIISSEHAVIYTALEVDEINYIPAYLDSILLNLLTNAIKYKHQERNPEIYIKTYKNDSQTFMEIKDNGRGIDMEKFGDKLFGMYKTFHLNKDAVGIGLFLTRNQIESLGGTITASSQVGVGTTFTICF